MPQLRLDQWQPSANPRSSTAQPTRSLDAMRITTKDMAARPPPFRPRLPHAMAANPAQKRTRGEIEGEAGAFGRFFEMAAFLGRRRRPKFRAIVT